jgi:hypothetical protein
VAAVVVVKTLVVVVELVVWFTTHQLVLEQVHIPLLLVQVELKVGIALFRDLMAPIPM